MVTKAMKHTLIISTTTCEDAVDAGGGRSASGRARAGSWARRGDADGRIDAIGREGGTHRRDLEPRRVVRVVTQHGHVVTLLSARRGAGATPGVPASQAAPCSSRPRIEGVVKVRIARKMSGIGTRGCARGCWIPAASERARTGRGVPASERRRRSRHASSIGCGRRDL